MPGQATESAVTLRVWIAISLACAFGIFAFAGAVGLTGSKLAGIGVAAATAGLVAWTVWRRALVPVDEIVSSRGLKVVSGLATIAALFLLTRLCVFMINPAQTGYALGATRGLGLIPDHSCLSAYYVAARSAATVPNVYADELYSLPSETATAQRKPRRLESFNIDVYEYPPPFLVLPRTLLMVAPDFLRFRMIWFGLNGAVLLIGLLVIPRLLGPIAGTRALLLSPLVLASDVVVGTLQTGNLQVIVSSLAMIAMALLVRRRYAGGGALLAYATLSKLFPGLLLVYLLVRREWRALAWTMGLMAVLVAISLLDTGWTPYRAFLAHLPRLVGGESFPAFRNPGAIAKNYSVPGMAFKLSLFGVPGASFAAMKIVGWVYTILLVAATVLFARRRPAREDEPLVWLTILILASLRSPFLPSYAVVPVLWLLTLMAARVAPTARILTLALLAWAVLSFPIPQQGLDPKLISLLLLLPQAVIVVLIVLVSRGRPESPNLAPAFAS